MTKEEEFLQRIPGFTKMYKDNEKTKASLLASSNSRMRMSEEDVQRQLIYGEWLPPTCCNVFINALLLILTFVSIWW